MGIRHYYPNSGQTKKNICITYFDISHSRMLLQQFREEHVEIHSSHNPGTYQHQVNVSISNITAQAIRAKG